MGILTAADRPVHFEEEDRSLCGKYLGEKAANKLMRATKSVARTTCKLCKTELRKRESYF